MTTRKLLTTLFLLISGIASAQSLTGITPNTGVHLQTLQVSITGWGLFIQTSSPSGNIYQINLKQGPNTVSIFDWNNQSWPSLTNIINSDSVVSEFTIPISAVAGLYDLEVITGDVMLPWLNQVPYTLTGAFTIQPPDGYITGNVYNDLNRNGVKDVGELGVNNQQVKMLPGNITVSTNASGDYSIPVANGNYSVLYVPDPFSTLGYKFASGNDTLAVTVNNNTASGNDFGLKDALISVTPTVGFKGLTTTHQLVADEPIFTTGANPWGNVNSIYIINTLPFATYVNQSAVTVIDPYTIWVNIPIASNTNIATGLDIRVYTSGVFGGYHYLWDQFEVQVAPSTVSGSIFFDQNLNKVRDVNEPGIPNAAVQLTPDGTIGLANNSGTFYMGSLGGVQTLTPLYNIPGLVLFTDSTSYTFNATGTIGGKNFGFISSLPDYTIDVYDLSVFPRCNSAQNVSFKVRNTSNIMYNAAVWLSIDPLMDFNFSNIPPVTVSNDTIYWNISLPAYTEIQITASCDLPGAGNSISLIAMATSLNGSGVAQLNDIMIKGYETICSMDPNDKQVIPEGILAQHFTLMTDTLEYLIRFQNTGNDTAFNVVVLDTLDADLDFSTFEILGNSHSMQTELKPSGALRFTFNNILLVDSNANEPASHGYINYRIRANGSLPDSTEVNNTAYIYFDFNAAVVTNTTLNTLVYVLPTGLNEPDEADHVTLYPNPFRNSATLKFENPASDKYSLTISDVTGKIVAPEISTVGNVFVIEKKRLKEGLYFYQLVNTQTQKIHVGKMVIQ